MQIKKHLRFTILCIITALLFAGCVKDEDLSVTTDSPMSSYTDIKTESTLPQILTAPTLEQLDAVDKWRFTICFNEAMDPATITTDNIYVQDITNAPAAISGATVTYDAATMCAYLDVSYDDTAVNPELVVSSTVTDAAGNQLAGIAKNHTTFLDEQVVHDYRIGAGTFAPAKTTIAVATVGGNPGQVNVTVTFSNNDIWADSLDQANFSVTGGTITGYTENTLVAGSTRNYITSITFSITGLTANTEYTITFNPDGVRTTSVYGDGSDISKTVLFDTYGDNATEKLRSDYIKPFKTLVSTAPTPPTGSINDGAVNETTEQIDFGMAMDPATVLDPNNYIAYSGAAGTGDVLELSVTPVYTDNAGSIEIRSVKVSTMNYSQTTMESLRLKGTISSVSNGTLDGNGNGVCEGDADYDNDGSPDDWKLFN